MGDIVKFPRARHPQGGLTTKQLKAMQFIIGFRARYGGVWPSLWNIAEAIGVRTEMGAQRIVGRLLDAGAIERPADMPRGWR